MTTRTNLSALALKYSTLTVFFMIALVAAGVFAFFNLGRGEDPPVTIARWRDETAAIASGVKDGELIATAGVHKLEAGQKVKPMPAQLQAAR